MKNKLYLIISVLFVFMESCYKNNSLAKLDFPRVMQDEISSLKTNKNLFVYYHPGDCSFCYGSILAISKEFPEIPVVSISASKDYEIVGYYLEQMSFKGISLIDSNSIFLQNNQKELSSKSLFLIDLQFNIKVAVPSFDERSKAKFKRVIAN